ncbi:DNA replication licensing factor MCM9 [Eufriesea mexicana]|uniref:DNA helicase MCM9-like n=1 Tax=Eufriesea mexicana TaxID=516756 RepID=UPI00083C24BE|nr:PREDICTED: DNA helicase MCM9-like [Eufriesea mexicana]OAD61088.1 DNA replication licensing factor MCM9 [Eufriesea mexicana]
MLEKYLLQNHQEELEEILDNIDASCYYSIYVNFVSLFGEDADIAQKILRYPRYYLPLCHEAAVKAQEEIAKPEQVVKKKIRIRITAVPLALDQGQIGQLVSMSGIIVRISQPTILKSVQRYICRKCKHVTLANYEWERQSFADIIECEACHTPKLKVLTGFDLEDSSDCQEIGLQEKYRGETNRSLTEELRIILLDDLVDKCRPGDHVEISGVVIRIWGPLEVDERLEASTMMLANSIVVRRKISDTSSSQEMKDVFKRYWENYNDNPLLGRDNILASICPQLYGMYTAKLALAVVLAGGVPKCNESGTRVRGEPHLLLVGDPGTGKSQLLRAASRLAIRSVLTTGVGSTAAGLTATAVRDSEGWHLEGGALVLADGGVCCVDEFTTMSSQDRTSVHEAMEQQTISIAKAGLVSTLNSRCSVIAAINPTGGQFTEDEEWETNLGDPLLSRFDLILLMKDNRNSEWDRLTSEHILKAAVEKKENIAQTDSKTHIELLKTECLWKEDTLREYLAYVHSLEPKLTKEAEMVLRATYLYHRSHPDRREERTTVRLLDSLIRLAEGHARLMYRSNIEIMDAIFVAKLVGTYCTSEINLGCSFPTDPIATYRSEGETLLRAIGLQSLENLL